MKKYLSLIVIVMFALSSFSSTTGGGQPYGTDKAMSFEVFNGVDSVGPGVCDVKGVVISSATAGDIVKIYNAYSATGSPVLEVYVGVNTSSVPIMFGDGIAFSTDVYVDVEDSAMYVTLLYTQ